MATIKICSIELLKLAKVTPRKHLTEKKENKFILF